MRKLLIAFAATAALAAPAFAGHSGGHSSGGYSSGGRSMGGMSYGHGSSSYSHPMSARGPEHFTRDRDDRRVRDRDDFRRVRDRDDFRRDRDDFRHHHRRFVLGFGFWDFEGCPPGYYLDWRGYCVPVY